MPTWTLIQFDLIFNTILALPATALGLLAFSTEPNYQRVVCRHRLSRDPTMTTNLRPQPQPRSCPRLHPSPVRRLHPHLSPSTLTCSLPIGITPYSLLQPLNIILTLALPRDLPPGRLPDNSGRLERLL